MDSLEQITKGVELYRKEVKDLTHERNFLKTTNEDLKAEKEKLTKDISALSAKKLSIETEARSEKEAIYKRIEDKEKEVDLAKTKLTEDRIAFEKETQAFRRIALALQAENDDLKSKSAGVEKLRIELESKLAKHREAVETLR